jgi:hypothetical protein
VFSPNPACDVRYTGKRYAMEQQVTNGEEDLVEVEAGVKVEGELWDLNRPLEGDCTLALIKFGVRSRARAQFTRARPATAPRAPHGRACALPGCSCLRAPLRDADETLQCCLPPEVKSRRAKL